ncbi:hypothetical protein AB9P05_13975 [Roseivirga sp. BDSF3-8]|uniref:hypothetical protein n=1 Tax=Roseivirga sp. BDSF3-8 TaxID=3241598 RepID=UPI0035318CE0
MSLKEHDIRLIEDFIGDSLNESSLEEFAVKKATSKEFYELLTMQDEVLHDLTEDLYKACVKEEENSGIRPVPIDLKPFKKAGDFFKPDHVGLALMIFAGMGLTFMALILISLQTVYGF